MNIYAANVLSSIADMSGDFHRDSVSPWSDDDEIVPMDVWTASSIGDYEFVRYFLHSNQKSITINKRNPSGWSPLMYASYVGHKSVVELLLKEGDVDVDARSGDKRSATSLMLAASCGKEGVVELLFLSGADINASDERGYTPLLYAILYHHDEVVKKLINLGADLEKREHVYGLTPLLLAAKEGHGSLFKGLFEIMKSSSNIKAKTTKGLTARDLAYKNGHMAIVNLIDLEYMRQFSPSSMVRSDPGLTTDDGSISPHDFASSPGTSPRDINWMYGSPKTGIKHGPKAFARLVNQKSADFIGYSRNNIHMSNANQPQFLQSPDYVCSGTSSPRIIPRSQSYDSQPSQGSSYEDIFFARSGGTIKDSSLNERLMKLELQSNGVLSPQRTGASFPQFPGSPVISEFLQDLNLDKYVPIFVEEEVDFDTLLTLNDDDLKEIGIKLLGPRKKITTAIAAWNERQSTRSVASLPNELSELKIQLNEQTLQLQQQERYLNEEKKLRAAVENKNLQANIKAKKVASSVSQTLPELEGLSKILSSLCDKTNDDVTKEVFTKLAESVDKITPILKEIAENDDSCTTKPADTKDLSSKCVHNEAG